MEKFYNLTSIFSHVVYDDYGGRGKEKTYRGVGGSQPAEM